MNTIFWKKAEDRFDIEIKPRRGKISVKDIAIFMGDMI